MKRHKHSLSNYRLTTCDMGELVPVGWLEVLPGDTFQHRTSAMIRVSPLVAPVMHPVQVRIHHWFVPLRIMWDGFEDFITGEDTTPPPTMTAATSTLWDNLGVPPQTAGLEVSAFPFNAYNMIYNEWYRDQDLQIEREPDATGLRKIAWEKDYYTTARPWPQKGDAITLPLGTKAPVSGLGWADGGNTIASVPSQESGGIDQIYAQGAITGGSHRELVAEEDPDNTTYPNIYADLSQAEALNVNDLRKAFALQRYQEARARYGSRYTEYLRYLGVRSSDARLQRPEYLGGGRCNISFSEVLQTGPDTQGGTDSSVGDLLGHGIATCRTRKYRRFFEEHGIVMTMLSVRPKSMYVNGIGRKWLRTTKEQYYQKELETIGQQEVFNAEVYADPAEQPLGTFGWGDRYRDYRYERSEVCRDFRNTFDYWHLGRKFSSLPTLNAAFVECDPSKRIHAVQTEDVLWCMIKHNVQARRMVSKSALSRIE